MAWSPDGSRIASASWDNTVQVWNARTGAEITTYTGHTDNVNTVTWSPDGRHIASGSEDMTIQIWDAGTGEEVLAYKGHSALVETVAWSPDGTRVASGSSDKTVQVWSALTGERQVTQDDLGIVYTLAWSPDGKKSPTVRHFKHGRLPIPKALWSCFQVTRQCSKPYLGS